ncbi:BTB/POZ domain-containing protein [Phthorimaea operculella]|nr:BTB/POZ domain-containing protein [Phthorimaea operculella]
MAPRKKEWRNSRRYSKIYMRASYVLEMRKWTDCTFHFDTDEGAAAGGSTESLDAHKLILAMASPVFEAMFYGNVGDQKNPAVNITDIDRPTFAALLKYIYTDDTDIPHVEAAIRLFKAANKYMVVHLEDICFYYVYNNVSPDNVCQVYEFACLFGEKSLEEKCLELFSTKTQLVLKGSSFLSAEADTVKKITSMDTLDLDTEMDLFNALLDYAENAITPDINQNIEVQSHKDIMHHGQGDMRASNDDDKVNQERLEDHSRQEHILERSKLNDIIKNIRLLTITPSDLAKIYENSTFLSEGQICALLSNMCSPHSSVPMPGGFSSVREPRIRGSATFQHTVHNVTNMTTNDTYITPLCYVRNLPWSISATKLTSLSAEYLGFQVNIDSNAINFLGPSKDWSCDAKVEYRLLSADPNVKPRIENTKLKLGANQSNLKYFFISWKELIDPKNCFIKEDSVTIEVHITTEETLYCRKR